MANTQTSRDVNAKAAIKAIKGPESNAEIMERFKISSRGFADLLKQLFEAKMISEEDLDRRGIRFKVMKKKKDSAPVKEAPPKAPPKTPPIAPPPKEHDDEFVDTVTLTEMLMSGGLGAPVDIDIDEEEIEAPASQAAEDEKSSGKKGKFSLTGLFKKEQ